MKIMRITGRAALSAALALAPAACSLDVTNPNATAEETVVSTPAGLRALAIGLQGRLGNAIEEGVWIPGLVSGELGGTNNSQSTQREFQRFPLASANTAIEETNPELQDLWSKYYAVVRSANDILENVDAVSLTAETRSGIRALAKMSKAYAFGSLIESFEQIPLEPDQEDPAFSARPAVLQAALDLLASARVDLATTAPTAEFNTQILAPGLDLLNTIRALQARYSLAAGEYDEAIAFADEVPAAAASEIRYVSTDPNPLWGAFTSNAYFAARAAFRTDAEAGDTRVNRFTTAATFAGTGGETLAPLNVYRLVNDPIPLFTQEELTLIRAEAHARAGRLPEARTQVNLVRTANALPARTDAELPTEAAVLDEIYRQRTYSLFLMGLHWADQRRFGRLTEAKVRYLPYPLAERNNNPNTPANPTP
jgi:hypothetical protein